MNTFFKTSNSRLDFQHKLTKWLVIEFDIICTETLSIKTMLQKKQLSKHISDAAWYQFITLLKYKADWYMVKLLYKLISFILVLKLVLIVKVLILI